MENDVNETEEIINDDELMSNEIPENNAPSLENNEADMTIEPPKNNTLLGVASKKLIALILKRKVIAISIIAAFILLIFVAFLSASISSKVNDYQYVEQDCENVTIKYVNLGEDSTSETTQSIETYVANATYTLTKDFKDAGAINYHVYKSLAIALRTEAVSNSCTVTYHQKLQSKVDNQFLDEALEQAKGLIATENSSDKPLNIHVSSFCYATNDGENYTINQVPDFKIPSSWVNKNITNTTLKDCPCNKPDENLTACYNNDVWLHQENNTGYDVYSAKYLNEEKGFNAETLLKYFIGNHTLKTIIDPDTKETEEEGEKCDNFDFHKSSLSKSEFVSKLKSETYYTNGYSLGMGIFKEHAEDIYDIATANNLNPEFVVIRAVLEGFSPSAKDNKTTYADKNNYWGYHCYNGADLSTCYTFEGTFKDAIKEYAIKMTTTYYNSMEDIYTKYAVPDDKWTKNMCEGYKEAMYPDGVPYRVEEACQNYGSTPTDDVDRKAYADMQKRDMAVVRKRIFDIDGGDCNGAGCYWWPIGSDDTTMKGLKQFATGEPAAKTITSGFGLRSAPTAGASTTHNAIDISGVVSENTNIIAAADGTVTEVFTGCVKGNTSCGGGLGNAVYITHNDGTITRYGHLSSVSVVKGEAVKQGQVIGKMGTTGVSTGLHLDFQVKVNGTPVDPLNYVSSADPRTKCFGDGSIVKGKDNKQTICKTLKHNGYDNNAVAAILDNIDHESSYEPVSPNGYGCDGIVQWCPDIDTVKETYGEDWVLLENQLKYLMHELPIDYVDVYNYLKENHTASEKADYFCMHYEIPGETYSEQRYYCNQRLDTASYLDYVENNCSD